MNAPAPSTDDKTMAGICYFGLLLCLIPTVIIFLTKKDTSQHAKFHSLQAIGVALIALVLWTIVGVVTFVISMVIPFVGPVLSGILSFVFGLAVFIYVIKLGMDALGGKEIEIPYVGEFIRKNLMA